MEEEEVHWINRTAYLGMKYYVINTETGVVIAQKTLEDSIQEEREESDEDLLPAPVDMYKSITDSFMPFVARQLAPYRVQESRVMMKDKSKDSDMKAADKYVKGGVYDRAFEIYLDVWKRTQNPAAGHNAAILYEVMGDIDSAITLMRQVVDKYPDKKIMKQFNRLLKVKMEQKRLAEQLV
jgi:hypothetical protein